jgi:hypothetical protein
VKTFLQSSASYFNCVLNAVIYCLLFLTFANAHPPAQDFHELYLSGYQYRADHVVTAFDTSSNLNYYVVAAKYARGERVAEADSMFLELLKDPRGDMFWMFPVIGAYLHGKNVMAGEVKNAVRNAWKTYAPYRGDTENHWCMYYASLYLAAEQWPGLPGSEWFNGKSSVENLIESKDYLIHWIKVTTSIGQGEFDSPDYLPEYMIPMVLLAQFAKNPDMRKRARMMADYLLADFAVEHLDGQYVGGFSRITEPGVYEPLRSNSSAYAHLYFGTGETSTSAWILFPALSDYRMPEIIYHIATDRNTGYAHRERKRVRNVIRYGDEINPPVYKYTYMTAEYGMGSLHGGILQPIQQQTWNVRYTSGRPHTAIFGLHPYWSGYELAMFFPQRKKTLVADVVPSKRTYNQPDKWTGGSPYERTFQHKNTLIVLYDIPEGTTSEHISGFFPKTIDEITHDDSGWIGARAGNTLIGWYQLRDYEWREEEINWRLHSPYRQNGYIIEVRTMGEYDDLLHFVTTLRNHIPESTISEGDVSATYRNLNGGLLNFSFPDKRFLNGSEVDLSDYKLFDGAFLQAEVGSQKLTMRYKEMKRVLNFKTLEITDQ